MQNRAGSVPASGRFLVIAASFVVIVAGLKASSAIVVPFLLAAFIAILCSPPLFWLQSKKVPTTAAVLIVILILITAGLLVVVFIGSSLNDFLSRLPEYQESLREETAGLISWLQGMGINLALQPLRESFDPGVAMQMVGNMLSGLGGVLTNAFLIILTVVFILLEAADIPLKVRAAIGDPDASLTDFKRFLESVNRYMAMKTIISIGTGMVIALWLTILGVDYPLLWGMLAFLLNFIPNIGSIIAAVPAVLLGFIQFGIGPALLTGAGYVFVNVVFGNIVEPKVMGKGLGISTLVVFLSLVFWGWILGPVGMLLSMPLTMIVKIALESRNDTRWISILLGTAASCEQPSVNKA